MESGTEPDTIPDVLGREHRVSRWGLSQSQPHFSRSQRTGWDPNEKPLLWEGSHSLTTVGDWGCALCPAGAQSGCWHWGLPWGQSHPLYPVASALPVTMSPPPALPQLQPHLQRGAQHVPHGPGRIHSLAGQHHQVRLEPGVLARLGRGWGGQLSGQMQAARPAGKAPARVLCCCS